jgi:preprotein translocase subunit SecD
VLTVQPYVTPEQLEAATSTTTTVPGETTTTAPGGTTTTNSTAPADEAEGAVGGIGLGESASALPAQATTTTTTAPATTTTAPGATTTTVPGATTTTSPLDAEDLDGCVLLGGTTPSEQDTLDATVVLPGDDSPDDPDDLPEFCYQLGPVPSDDSGYLVGGVVTNPEAQINSGEWGVALGIKGDSLALFNTTATACYVGAPMCPAQGDDGRGRLAIVLDGVVESAPSINEPTFSGDGLTISGNMGQQDARDLALVLRYGALPIELEAQTVQSVSATLGEDSLRAGLIAGLLGISLVFLYLFIYYRALGLVVVAGTAVWSALNYSVIAWLGETQDLALSLAGVTGIVISVGVTVDAYVVYFERLKDEMRSGRTVRASIDRGFHRAFRTIFAANVSSLIGAAFLFALTVGPVRGFAFFLGLSTVLGLVVAWFFTRPLMSLLGRTHLFTDHPILGVGRGLGAPVGAPAAEGAT